MALVTYINGYFQLGLDLNLCRFFYILMHAIIILLVSVRLDGMS